MTKTREERLAQNRAYWAANKERLLKDNKQYRDTHKEECSQRAKAYYLAHKDEVLARNRAYQASHKEDISKKTKAYLLTHTEERRQAKRLYYYGISRASFNSILDEQGGVCGVCKKSHWGGRHGTPHVDHDHKTGRVRGILCQKCNIALGMVDDNPSIARSLANYLERAS